MLKLNGYNLTRLDFQQINKGSTIVGNINNIMLNNTYYGKFISALKNKILASLLHKYTDVREFYIMYMYKLSIDDKIREFTNLKNYNLKLINTYTNNCKTSTSMRSYEENYRYLEKLKSKKKVIKNLYDEYTKLANDINSESNDSDFKELFNLKNKCRDAKYTNAITFKDIANLLKFKPVDYKKLITIIYINGIINDDDLSYNLINITWKQLSVVISDYNDAKDLQKLLMSYYIEIEESYEKIILMINQHTESISGDEFVYKMCMQYIINKNSSTDQTQIRKLKIENTKLHDENKTLTKENIFLKDVNGAYMRKYEPVKIYAAHKQYKFKDIGEPLPIIKFSSDYSSDEIDTPEEFARKLGVEVVIPDSDSSVVETDVETDSEIDDGF